MGRKIGAVSFLEILAPELNDRILSDILDLETGVIVNLHIRSIDQTEAIKTIKRKITAGVNAPTSPVKHFINGITCCLLSSFPFMSVFAFVRP